MDNATSTRILAGITEGSVAAHETSKRFGYWDKERTTHDFVTVVRSELQDISLLVHEKVEGQESTTMPHYTRLEEEMADIIIRVLDFARGRDLNIGSAVVSKMEYNEALSRIGKGF